MDNIYNKNALISGGSRGIGRAIALLLAKNGINLCINYLNNKEMATSLLEEVKTTGIKAIICRADVSDLASVRKMVKEARDRLGSIDILVNNAGIIHKDKLENITEGDWDRVMDVNLKSAFLITQECLPDMRKNRWGRIINISSIAAQTGGVTGPLYVASKAGMVGLAHSYAAILAKEGITANSVNPALIETDMLLDSVKEKAPPVPVGRFGLPEEVAEAVLLLVKNGYMTGQTINVNGGWYFS